MATAGYAVTLKVSGDAVEMAGESLTNNGDDTLTITDATKRILDPDTETIVLVDGSPVSSGVTVVIDYLFGIVWFPGGVPTGTITLVGAYLPLLTVAEARGGSLALSRDELDTTVYGDAYKKSILGMSSGELSLSTLRLLETSLDIDGDADTCRALLDDGTAKLLEVDFVSEKWRGWVCFPSLAEEMPPDGLVASSVTAKTVTRRAAGRAEVVAYGFGE